MGHDDIDFGSDEFSRQFRVRAKDKETASEVCHAGMIEYLLANQDLSITLDGTSLVLAFNSRLAVGEIEYNLDRGLKIRSLLPDGPS